MGLYDVYASAWFVVIMMFLVVSTSLCLIRNVPPFWREMKSFREKVKEKSLAAMRHSSLLDVKLPPKLPNVIWRCGVFREKPSAVRTGRF
ncbi:cytochrome biogenesis protein [Neisseria gonorrhoeae]|uniref:Cytochrome biogenesis protein n=1 Tax=Neisseria gonorrhoeae TaxID=485 RepID=A0A378W0F7_NEIGO|nr:cytochrome biogenesis protein [Neisseria gonorrhoeae]